MSTITEAWLLIATGGRWTAAQVCHELPSHKRKTVESALTAMTGYGALREYDGTPLTYGVTPACTPPRGITVAEILKAIRDAAA